MRLPRIVVALPLVIVLIAAACVPSAGPAETPNDSPGSPVSSPSEFVTTPEPSLPVDPSEEPVATASATSIVEPTLPPPSESAGPGAADACSGSDQNREFFEAAAAALDWTVYCAVLPSGWFVTSGEYRQAGGGRLEIAYRGPGGALLELHEGAFCADGDGCVPSGTATGDAPFGDQTGTLIATDDGGWALVVDQGEMLSWLAVGSGLDEDAFRAITDALTAVDG